MHSLQMLLDLIDSSPVYKRVIKEDGYDIYIGVGNVINKRMIAIMYYNHYTGRRIEMHEVHDVMRELGDRLYG